MNPSPSLPLGLALASSLSLGAFAGPVLAQSASTAPFAPIDTGFAPVTHVVPPSPVKSAVLFRGAKDTVVNKDGVKTLARDWNDFTGYIPINGRSDSGYVIVNNEQNVRDSLLGDGGGMTVFTAHMKNSMWHVAPHPKGMFRAVDFSNVGGTIANCGGHQTPWGTALTAEEWEQPNNAAIYDSGRGIRDTGDVTLTSFNGAAVNKTLKKYQNYNWIVEVDVANAKALRKHHSMGRFEHEIGYLMPDRKTVYLTDDATPAVFFKYIADEAEKLEKGKLYAYRQSEDGMGGEWLEMPMELDSLMQARNMAMKRGATLFTRHEWAVEADGKLYITETGRDQSTAHYLARKKYPAAQIAKHLRERMAPGDSVITDYFGRVLRFDPLTNRMEVLLEGGPGINNPQQHLSNPDGLTTVTVDGRKYLVIQEDLNGTTQGRVSAAANTAKRIICEMYWLDLAVANPKVDDLKRFVVGPTGSEITGARFTPDGKTLFVNFQHPAPTNPEPYNTSYTAAVWGYGAEGSTGLFQAPKFDKSSAFQVKSDALSRYVYFNRKSNVTLFDSAGKKLETKRGVDRLDIAQLRPGTYFVRNEKREMVRLVIE